MEKPITISLKLFGQDRLEDVDNVLEFLRSLDIDPLKIKSRTTFTVSYGGNTYRKILTITQMKRLLGNDIVRQMTAKMINNACGIICNSYE